MVPKHTCDDVIFLLKILQNLPHNLQDQVQASEAAQYSLLWFSLCLSPKAKLRSPYATCHFSPPHLWTRGSLSLDCCLHPHLPLFPSSWSSSSFFQFLLILIHFQSANQSLEIVLEFLWKFSDSPSLITLTLLQAPTASGQALPDYNYMSASSPRC